MKKRAISELFGALLLATIVLGAMVWLLAQWQKSVSQLSQQVNLITKQAEVGAIRVDCSGNYLVGLATETSSGTVSVSLTHPLVVDINKTNLGNWSFCYAALNIPKFRAYVIIKGACTVSSSRVPMIWIIYGTFTKTTVTNAVLYHFLQTTTTAVVPDTITTDCTYDPFATFHIEMPNGLEKIVQCVMNVTTVTWTINPTSTVNAVVWVPKSCQG